MDYKFNYEGKDYILNQDNCEGIFFNEEKIERSAGRWGSPPAGRAASSGTSP